MKKSNPIPYLKRLTGIFQWGNYSRQGYYPDPKCWSPCVYANLIRAMRSWRGRDEVDPMSAKFENALKELDVESLSVFTDQAEMSKRLFVRKGQMESQLQNIKNFFDAVTVSNSDPACMHDDLGQICVLIDEIKETNASDVLSIEERQDEIFCKSDILIGNLDLLKRTYSGSIPKYISPKISSVTNIIEASGINYRNSITVSNKIYLIYKSIHDSNFDEMSQYVEDILSIFKLYSYQFRNEEYLFEQLLNIANPFINLEPSDLNPSSILLRIRQSFLELSQIINDLSEKKLIPFELDDEITCLIPDSAEGEEQESTPVSNAVQAFIDTYDEWSDVYDSLATK